jgi:uncharacterized protein (DUF2267 family)
MKFSGWEGIELTVEQFLAEVKEKGDLDNKEQAEKASRLVLNMISGLVDVEAYNRIKVSLPGEVQSWWSRDLFSRFFSQDRLRNRIRRKLFAQVQVELPNTKQPRVVTWAGLSPLKNKIGAKDCDKIADYLPDELEQLWEMPSIFVQKRARRQGDDLDEI